VTLKKPEPVKRASAHTLIEHHIESVASALAKQFDKLIAKAFREGIAVVVDSDAIALRLIPRDVVDRGDDLRQLGDIVRVHNACGSSPARVSGRACNDGNL
jgi:hypothetical protein